MTALGSNLAGKFKFLIIGLVTLIFMMSWLLLVIAVCEPFECIESSLLVDVRMLASGFSIYEVSWLKMVSTMAPRLYI